MSWRYCYDDCVELGQVPAKPILTATGKDLNTLMDLIREDDLGWEYWVYEGGEKQWYALDGVHFKEDREYNLRELGSFEWPGCVWDEPLMFAYNKWKHTGRAYFLMGFVTELKEMENGGTK